MVMVYVNLDIVHNLMITKKNKDVMNDLEMILKYVRIFGPIIVVVYTTYDYIAAKIILYAKTNSITIPKII